MIAQRTVGEVFADEQVAASAVARSAAADRPRRRRSKSTATAFVRARHQSLFGAVRPRRKGRTLTWSPAIESARARRPEPRSLQHARSWGRRQVFEIPAHRAALIDEKAAARALKGRDRLRAEVRRDRVASSSAGCDHRLNLGAGSPGDQAARPYGAPVFAPCRGHRDARHSPTSARMAIACEQRRKDRKRPSRRARRLPDHVDDADVVPHDLGVLR